MTSRALEITAMANEVAGGKHNGSMPRNAPLNALMIASQNDASALSSDNTP